MDYYQKYLKYKIKYMRLKEQIEGGVNKKKGEPCTGDKDCENNLYCGSGNTCKAQKSKRANCTRARQCTSYNCRKPAYSGIHGSQKCE
jgi:hypothetical protein